MIGGAAAADDVRGLAQLLVDAVDGNAGVSFLAGLTADEAEAWCARGTTRNGNPDGSIGDTVFFYKTLAP